MKVQFGDVFINLKQPNQSTHDLIDSMLKCIPSVVKNDLELAEEIADKVRAVLDEIKVWTEARSKYMDRLGEIYCKQIMPEKNADSSKPIMAEAYDNRFVYLVTEGTNQKIGVAQDVEKRVIGMQTSCPYELRIVATYAPTKLAAFDLEKVLHSHYAPNRLKGEWFSINLSAEEFKEVCEAYDKNMEG